jgi:hypothetical protein
MLMMQVYSGEYIELIRNSQEKIFQDQITKKKSMNAWLDGCMARLKIKETRLKKKHWYVIRQQTLDRKSRARSAERTLILLLNRLPKPTILFFNHSAETWKRSKMLSDYQCMIFCNKIKYLSFANFCFFRQDVINRQPIRVF